MSRLLIHFADENLDALRWAVAEDDNNSSDFDWQLSNADELSDIAAKNAFAVTLLVPQQCVFLTEVEVPEKASRQVLNAIEFQIEDRLAKDIESQHFAIADSSANPVSIAVIDKAIVAKCLQLCSDNGLRLQQLLPEIFLVPWAGSGIGLMQGYDGYLLRYGDYQGLKCSLDTLPTILAMIERDVDATISWYSKNPDSPFEIDNVELQAVSLDAVASGLVGPSLIDLQQREFQLSSVWKGVGKAWKWIGIILVLLLAASAYNKAIALQQLEDELAGIKNQQYELLKSYLPASASVDANLKKMLIDVLKERQSGQEEQGFLSLLVDFTRAKGKFADVTITRIGYQGQRLNVDVKSKKLSQIEALHKAVAEQGVAARLENLNIKPEQISGRLILQAENDV